MLADLLGAAFVRTRPELLGVLSRPVDPAPSALAFIDVYALIPPLQIEKGIARRIEAHAPHSCDEYPMIAAVDDLVSFALE